MCVSRESQSTVEKCDSSIDCSIDRRSEDNICSTGINMQGDNSTQSKCVYQFFKAKNAMTSRNRFEIC